MFLRRSLTLFAILLTLAPVLTAQAQSEADDPPDRVGRIAVVEGNVSIRSPEQTDWSAAVVNYPVSAGTAIWTESGARTELNFGTTALRLDGLTEASIIRLEDGAVGVRVDRGSINLRIAHPIENTRVAVDTPRGRFDLITAGTYHIDAGGGDRPTRIAVLEGEARFAGRTYIGVRTGEALDIRGNPETTNTGRAERTAFDDWAMARDQASEAPRTARYVSPATPGYQELDRAGTWTQTPDYGAVWYPTAVPVGWAPYRYGHWAWVWPWGWTWIDDAPWGFAPFHYGRWAYYYDRWCWVPGPVVRRPIYAPALVAFVGGPTFVIQIGGRRAPAVGWVPLAPREVYRPPYRHSTTYVRNINVVHVDKTVVNNITVNDRDRDGDRNVDRNVDRFANRRAATVVPEEAMRRSERIDRAAIRRDDAGPALESARVTHELPQRAAPASPRSGPPGRSFGPDQGRDRPEAAPGSEPQQERREPRPQSPPQKTERPAAPSKTQEQRPAATPEVVRPSSRQEAPMRHDRMPPAASTETKRPDAPPAPRQEAPARVEPRKDNPPAREKQRPEASAPTVVRPMTVQPPAQRQEPPSPRFEQRQREAAPAPESRRQEAPQPRMARPEPQAKQVERSQPQPKPQPQPQREAPRSSGRGECPPNTTCKN